MWKPNVKAHDSRSQNSLFSAILSRCLWFVPFLRPRRWRVPSMPFAALILATAILAPVAQAQTCVYTLNPTSTILLSSNGGSGFSTNVAIPTSCITSGSFTAKSNAPWIRLQGSANFDGSVTYFGTSATVRYNLDPNPDTTSRSGTITIAGKTFTVNQAGAPPCNFTLSPNSASISDAGGSGFKVAVSVSNSPSGCAPAPTFDAKSNTPWIQLQGGPFNSDGSVTYFSNIAGSSTVFYRVNSNPYPTPDTGTITIAGRTFTVNQAGAGSTACAYTLNPTSASIPNAGGSGFSVTVAIVPGCSTSGTISVKSNVSWIHIAGPANPDGSVTFSGSNVTVFYSVDPNPKASTDTGTITIAGQTFTVNQAGTAAGPGTPSGTVTVIEYYNASLDHYFITWIQTEIALLDAGTQIKGWVRTGQSFKAFATAQAGTSPVCRYYIPPGLGDSHFFGRGTAECNSTGQNNPSFVLEDPNFMHLFLPVLGVCPAGTIAIYRVFSDRLDANHRYMIDLLIRNQMVALRWLAEGDGPNLVVMCAPP